MHDGRNILTESLIFWACPCQDPLTENDSRRGRAVRSRFPMKNRESSTAITHAADVHKKTDLKIQTGHFFKLLATVECNNCFKITAQQK